MESKRPEPQLSLQPFDPEVFQRVWQRVMPDQAHSPIAVDVDGAGTPRPAVPALSHVPTEEEPLPCLGDSSRRYLSAIQEAMGETQELSRAMQSLARRCPPRQARTLSALAGDLQLEQRRLSAAYFLIAGERYTPRTAGSVLSGPVDMALRTLFRRFLRRAGQVRSCAREMEDPCLCQLFQDLGDGAEDCAARLRLLLEGM